METHSIENLKLDPWSASSLLQKAIRRGEPELAKTAANTFFRYRGAAIWRRLCTNAVEDIGIADVALLQEVVRLSADRALRAALGSDAELIDHICERMALAVKDRSADYLYCAAIKLEAAKEEAEHLRSHPCESVVALAADATVPIIQRANAALIAVCDAKLKLIPRRVEAFLVAFPTRHASLEDAVLGLARMGVHPFCLMLPLLWSRFWQDGLPTKIVDDVIPVPEFVRSIPLYTFDKHTFVGKRAIERFALENDELRATLNRWVAIQRRTEVAGMAAFYTDAAPVAIRLDWATGNLLAKMGFMADMMEAGCPLSGAQSVLECSKSNLDHLNRLRREASAA